MRSIPNERGIALLAVLWGLLLLSTLASASIYIARSGALIGHLAELRAQADLTADAAIAKTIAGLSQEDASRVIPTDGSSTGWAFSEDETDIVVSKEGTRVDVNTASNEALSEFLASHGFDEHNRRTLVEQLRDWQKGTAGSALVDSDAPTAPSRTLLSPKDLQLIPAWGAVDLEACGEQFTVSSQLKSPEVISSTSTSQSPYSLAMSPKASGQSYPGDSKAHSFAGQMMRIQVSVRQRGGYVSSTVWVGRITGDKKKPMLTMRWEHGQTVRPIAVQ